MTAGTIHNMGGFLLNPPIECPNAKKYADGGVWVDFSLCSSNYCSLHPCERKRWWNTATSSMKNKDYIKAGVRAFIPW